MAKLEDIVKNITSGGTPYTQNDKFYDGDIPWLRTQEVNFNFIEDTEIKITPEGLKNSSAKWIPENSVIIAMYGNSAGRVAYSKIPLTTNQACCNITVDEKKADSLFLYYYLVKNYSNLEKLANGGAQQNLNVGIIKDFPFPNTPLSSQHRIANILSSFDNKIELLRKENNTLEDIAQSIFKEWFVKYNFPNKDGKPYRDNNGKMIDSELGLIPEGWRVGKLGEVITLQTGFVHNTSITGPAKSLIAKMGVVDGISRFNRNSVIPYSKSIDSKYKLEENDLIVCTRDVTRDNLVIGNVSQTPPDLAVRGLYAGSNTWIIKSNLNKNYLFLYLRERKFREHIIKSSKGSTIVMITQDAFLKCPYIFPQEEIINLFNETNEDLFKKAKVNDQEIQNLENIKSHLLNKLLT